MPDYPEIILLIYLP